MLTAHSGYARLTGEISCLGDIVIGVDKTLSLSGSTPVQGLHRANPLVVTSIYAYNAAVRNQGCILRHDNVHRHPGHKDSYHWHEFDWRSGAEVNGSPHCCGRAGWPTLGEFIEKVESWYHAHCMALPNRTAYAQLGLRRTVAGRP